MGVWGTGNTNHRRMLRAQRGLRDAWTPIVSPIARPRPPRVSDQGGDGVRSDPGVAGGDASQR